MAAEERRTTYREVLAHREFSAVLLAWSISMLGNVMAHVALSFLVFTRSGSPFLAAIAFSIGWVPHLFVGSLFSGLPDRVPARRLMVTADVLCALLVGLMVIPGLPIPLLLLLVVLEGCVTPVFQSGRASTLPDLLPGDHYVVGKALLSLVAQSSQLVGFALGGVLLAVISPATLLLVDAGSFVVSALVLRLATRERTTVRSPTTSMTRDSLDGMRQLFRNRRLRALLMLGWLPPMVGVIPEAMAIPYSSGRGSGGSGAGLLLAAVAGGVIVGEVVVARFMRPATRIRTMGALALAVSVPPLVFFARPAIAPAVALFFLSGLGWSYGLARSQLMLNALPLELRSRGLSVDTSGAMLTQGLGFVVAGAAAEFVRPQDVIAYGGLAGLLVTGIVLWQVRATAGTT
ncbi:MAG: major facilitator superfamily 1 [Frankiales bacterium]|nr:major facilitator superfamily 1 [Frankiales bacterium]